MILENVTWNLACSREGCVTHAVTVLVIYQCMSGNQGYVSLYYQQSYFITQIILIVFFSGQINHLYDV